jgi:hypothetical protein
MLSSTADALVARRPLCFLVAQQPDISQNGHRAALFDAAIPTLSEGRNG